MLPDVFGALPALPLGIQHRIEQVVGSLVGSLGKVPKAWIDETAAGIKDRAASQRAMDKALVDAAKRAVKSDDELINAAIEANLPRNIRKARNRLRVLHGAADFMRQEATAKEEEVDTQPIDEDWLNIFSRQAEDASSEKMRDLLTRILAGEIRKPRSYSLATLRIVSEMDQDLANDLQRVAASAIGDVIVTGQADNFGEPLIFYRRMASAGITLASPGELHKESMRDEGRVTIFGSGEGINLTSHPPKPFTVSIVPLSAVGQQLSHLMSRPGEREILRHIWNGIKDTPNIDHAVIFSVAPPNYVLENLK